MSWNLLYFDSEVLRWLAREDPAATAVVAVCDWAKRVTDNGPPIVGDLDEDVSVRVPGTETVVTYIPVVTERLVIITDISGI